MRIISDKSKNTVTLFINLDTDEIKSDVWNKLINGDEFSDFDYSITKSSNELEITFSLTNGKLFSNCAEQLSVEKALEFLSDFSEFVYDEDNNKAYVLGANNIFFDGERLRYLPDPVPIEQDRAGILKYFLNVLIDDNPSFDDEIKDELNQACADESAFPNSIIDTINRLRTASEKEAQEAAAAEFEEAQSQEAQCQPPAVNTEAGMYGETTLLGFTNYGETSILGGGTSESFDMPNLVRESTGEKIFITKRNFIIGKSREKTDYAIANNNAISRVHAELMVSGREYYIADKGSTNHTYVNGGMVNPESTVQIFDGDEIKLADEVFIFRLQ